ncbi:MAG: hypothetical protein M3O36_13595 [Myxococcota bacterium]|nr:hypothetical protein [Myxococcota bacterium]
MFPLPVVTVSAILAVLGTDRLGRPLTDEERKRFGALLREHDYAGARLVATRFAFKLARNPARAQDLMGRVDMRLGRLGWDPAEVSLVKRLCRLVWSEWTHAVGEDKTARRAEEGFVGELTATEGSSTPSVEERVADEERRREGQRGAQAQLERLRAAFEAAGDEVNLLWLDCALAGETDLQEIARRSHRDVSELYAAAKRRNRAVRRLLAEARGAKYGENDE